MTLNNYSKYFFVTWLVLSFSFFSYANKPTVKFLTSSNVPDNVIFYDDEKNQYTLDQFEGKTILLVFWATWCSPCIKELPDLNILQKDFRKLPFLVMPISQDQDVQIIYNHFKNYDIRYLPLFYDYRNQLFKAFSIVGLPTSILIDPDGKKVVSFTGSTNWHDEKIREIILSSIPGKHPEPKNTYVEQSLNQPVKSAIVESKKKQNSSENQQEIINESTKEKESNEPDK